MDGWTDKNSPCVLQDFVPFRAAALLPLKFTLKMLKQGKGIADHILPLGDLLYNVHSSYTIYSMEGKFFKDKLKWVGYIHNKLQVCRSSGSLLVCCSMM